MRFEGLDVVAVVPGVADADRVALAPLDGHRQRLAPHRHLDHVLDVAHLDAVPGRLLAVDVDLDVALAHDLVGDDVRRAPDCRGAPRRPPGSRAGVWSRSSPKTFTPIGERTPVESISIRLMIGCVKMLPQPGIWIAVSISATRSSFDLLPEQQPVGEGLLQRCPDGLKLVGGRVALGQSFRSRPSRFSSSIAAQVGGADGPVEQLPVERLDPLLEPRLVARDDQVSVDPREQVWPCGPRGSRPRARVARSSGAGGRRQEVGPIAEHAQRDQPRRGIVDRAPSTSS